MKLKMLCALVVSASTLAACSTVTRGTTSQIQIVSEPAGASVRTSMNHSCTTPCTLTVNRKDEFAVIISLAGYKEQTVEVKTRLAGAGVAGFAGNVIIGGVVGMGVDAVTGSTLEHFPNPLEIKLEKEAPAQAPPVSRRNRR
jgi:PEGA domain